MATGFLFLQMEALYDTQILRVGGQAGLWGVLLAFQAMLSLTLLPSQGACWCYINMSLPSKGVLCQLLNLWWLWYYSESPNTNRQIEVKWIAKCLFVRIGGYEPCVATSDSYVPDSDVHTPQQQLPTTLPFPFSCFSSLVIRALCWSL